MESGKGKGNELQDEDIIKGYFKYIKKLYN